MKQLFLDCGMGAAGDMLAASLLELLDKPERFVSDFNGIGLSDVVMQLETKKAAVSAEAMCVCSSQAVRSDRMTTACRSTFTEDAVGLLTRLQRL